MIIRIFDIVLSILLILILSPILVVTAIILLVTGEGEVLYFQNRIGRKGLEFKVFKFATMLKNSEKLGTGIYTSEGDNRILPIGSFLRKSKINELPQLFNVLFGQMSIVGPRPLIKETFDFYNDDIKSKLANLRPGITGIGSIVFRDESSLLQKTGDLSLEEFYRIKIAPYKGRLEEWYWGNQNIITYITIIILTVWVIISPKSRLVFRIYPDLPQSQFLR
jgi:lipopolysaccharide/colanic/teichoic acid biosynthesis glycosyltransferase